MRSRVTLLPSARRLMDSLREIGYDLPAALADLVDNSISANARRVDISFVFEGADSWILVADDGEGMTGTVLEEAMRYGTERVYRDGDLGRFGLGLKTASLSQCRRLTVASRRGCERRRIECRQWDLDHVATANRWEALRLGTDDVPDEVVAPLLSRPGTAVLWEGLDRILNYNAPQGAAAGHAFGQMRDEAGLHLSMVFHRFLAGEGSRRRRLTITVNGSALDAWDPFCRAEHNTRVLNPQSIPLGAERKNPAISVHPYVLPSQERFSSAAAHARAAGPQRWNRQQGLYIYRNDRLIQAGGWNRLRTLDEHTKLARIAIDLPRGCDDLFGVNVAKMRVIIPPQLRQPLTAIASGVAAQAGSSYRRLERAGASSMGRQLRPLPAVAEPLVATLTPSERDLLGTIVALVRDEFQDEPDVARRLLARIERLPSSVAGSTADVVQLAGRRARRPDRGAAVGIRQQ
jgi:hypothetical protein